MRWSIVILFLSVLYVGCEQSGEDLPLISDPYLVVLGIAQDAGFPQADCQKSCCAGAWENPDLRQMVSCVGIVDPSSRQAWMIDATPDFKDQLQLLLNHRKQSQLEFNGVLLTHAHIGHYTGLMHLGREVMGAKGIPVYAMPKMSDYLSSNGPWSQLVDLQNIKLTNLKQDSTVHLNESISIRPTLVPHRDEFSGTVGYEIHGPTKKAIFIPDIDKWSKWERNILDEVANFDYLLIDGSFYANGEIPNRDMSEIPHPFVEESMDMFSELDETEKAKIHFIHFNHTNPLLDDNAPEYKEVIKKGYRVSSSLDTFIL